MENARPVGISGFDAVRGLTKREWVVKASGGPGGTHPKNSMEA